jgi:tetratricopeptide (TPR) repeat protein
LVADFPSVPAYRAEQAKLLTNLAVGKAIAGEIAEAAGMFRRATTQLDRLVTDFPTTVEYRQSAAACWFNLARALETVGPQADAVAAYRRAADEYARLAVDNPSNTRAAADLAATWVALGDYKRASGRPAEALEWYDKAIARAPTGAAARDAHVGRADALTTLARFPEALAAWGAALKLGDPEHTLDIRLGQARTESLSGDHRRAAEIVRAVVAAGNPSAGILDRAARVLAKAASKADTTAADAYAAEAVTLLRRAHAAGRYREPRAAEQLRADADFAPIRERAEFQKFVSEIGN